MSETAATPTPSPTAELKMLVQGSMENVTVTDKSGTSYKIHPLDLADLCEYEDRVGTSLLLLNFNTLKVKDVAFMIYLSIRKSGLSLKEIEDRKFKLTENQMLRNFDLGLLTKSGTLIVDLLRISGLDVGKTNPQ
jgi:hypothetical protein